MLIACYLPVAVNVICLLLDGFAVVVSREIADSYEQSFACWLHVNFLGRFQLSQGGAGLLHGEPDSGPDFGVGGEKGAPRDLHSLPVLVFPVGGQKTVNENAHGVGVVVPFPF
jgi:hypothetical protein